MTTVNDAGSQARSDADPIKGALKHLQESQGVHAQTEAYFFGSQEYRAIQTTHDLKLLLKDRYARGQDENTLASLHLYHTLRLPNHPVFYP